MTDLLYVLEPRNDHITLDVFESETYSAAIVVQPLIGTLVYSTNYGTYEPRLASAWHREAPHIWAFELRSGFTCENGEAITPASFKKSLERMILAMESRAGSPVLKNLVGFADFMQSRENLSGIEATETGLRFTFDQPIRSGLVEVLSFTPYGYISAENLNADLSWKDPAKIVSSGPYRVKHLTIGEEYSLERRAEWEALSRAEAPRTIKIAHYLPYDRASYRAVIWDTFTSPEVAPHDLHAFKMAPDYLNAVLLGNMQRGPFKDAAVREALRAEVEAERDRDSNRFLDQSRASSFFLTGDTVVKREETPKSAALENLRGHTLLIEGREPKPRTAKNSSWKCLKTACERYGIRCQFANNDPSWSNMRSQEYDVRLRTWAVGKAAESWVIDSLFCSSTGPNFPDPSRRIHELVASFKTEQISEDELSDEFEMIIDTDAAIIPISHVGNKLYLSESIDQSSLSPFVVVLRYDQLAIADAPVHAEERFEEHAAPPM